MLAGLCRYGLNGEVGSVFAIMRKQMNVLLVLNFDARSSDISYCHDTVLTLMTIYECVGSALLQQRVLTFNVASRFTGD